jgi:hypothetical protein
MSAIEIVGGVYLERCIWPQWNQIYGSGGRAASALSGHVDSVRLHAYARPDAAASFQPYVDQYGFAFALNNAPQSLTFDYVHCMSIPMISPALSRLNKNPPIQVEGEVVLRFGMLEGSAIVKAHRCVYDPQSAFAPEPFSANGSSARHLAVVANRGEIVALGGNPDPIAAAQAVLTKESAEVVIVKAGSAGAFVVDGSGVTPVSAYRSDRVWTIGSGDVFAAAFAFAWGVNAIPAVAAATLASQAVAHYANTRQLPIPPGSELAGTSWQPVQAKPASIYLAGPFFTIGQRWLIDEARRGLGELGLDVFSPVHEIGNGPAHTVAPKDIAALEAADRVFAILDGTDSGTLFEVGYARARDKPVYALSQTVSDEDLKMVEGCGCRVFKDFVTALHHIAWH